MPPRLSYGVRAQAAALGVQRARVAAPVGFDFGAILAANATYAWWGDDLPASGSTGNWTDVIAGVVATATSDPQVGSLNGKRAAVFAGAQTFQATIPALPAQFAVVAVTQIGTAGANRAWAFGSSFELFHASGFWNVRQNNTVTLLPVSTNVTRVLIAQASSTITSNGVTEAWTSASISGLTAFAIGSRAGAIQWNGEIALTAIIAPDPLITDPALQLADVVARAAAVEAGALVEYSIV